MELKAVIGMDPFAYKEHYNTTMAFLQCQHDWLGWLDDDVDFVRVLSFDFSKAIDTVSHKIVCEKLKSINLSDIYHQLDYQYPWQPQREGRREWKDY